MAAVVSWLLRRRWRRLFAAFRYVVLTVWLLVVLFPMYWMVATSLKRPAEWFAWPPAYRRDWVSPYLE